MNLDLFRWGVPELHHNSILFSHFTFLFRLLRSSFSCFPETYWTTSSPYLLPFHFQAPFWTNEQVFDRLCQTENSCSWLYFFSNWFSYFRNWSTNKSNKGYNSIHIRFHVFFGKTINTFSRSRFPQQNFHFLNPMYCVHGVFYTRITP